MAIESKIAVNGLVLPAHVAVGVNSQEELATASRRLFLRNAKRHMAEGVIFIDPRASYVEDDVKIGSASVIYPGAYLRGGTRVGAFCVIEPHTYLNGVTLEDSVQILVGSHLEDCTVRTQSSIGPYARLRPETEIGRDARVGNFVELKKVKFGSGAKANHLAYLGDAEIGENTNIGCGTITCNYAVDRKKYKTKIGRDVFVGSDTQFVAPVTVGDGAIIGSGSTITKDVPAKALAVARAKQVNIENYHPKSKAKDGKEKENEK
jgi:bifunctional UDP-N-acetylglucosamine pyrophosphorylase/glucosamine-1-phosphate N-acetyltransferase